MDIKIVMRFHKNIPDGGRKIVFDYANYLISRGHKVCICFVANTPFHNRKYNNLLFFKYLYKYFKDRKKQFAVDWFKLNEKIRLEVKSEICANIVDNSRQIVIAFDYGVALSLAEHVLNIKQCVYLVQHDEKVYYSENVVREAWKLPMLKIVISSWLYEKINTADPGNVILIKNYVNFDDFYITKPISARKPIVSFIAHPNPYKGTKIAFEALEIVKKSIPELQVLIFGTRKLSRDIPQYYTYFRMANAQTLRESVYNQSSVYLLPSVLEGWGLTATEAMACGCALVSTRNGGVDDFGIDGYSALLCEVNNVDEISKKVIQLLNNPEQRERIAKNGLSKIADLKFQNSAKLFEKTLLRVQSQQ